MHSVDGSHSTALLTDHYELTMLDAALASGVAQRRATFEVFARRLPEGREYGIFGGLARLLECLERFRFGQKELDWLADQGFLSPNALEWLARYHFSGDIVAYQEGELYAAGSPVLTVDASFGEAVLLETLILSVLNHDSAIAAAASLVAAAAKDRPVIEMGSRRTDPEGAVAAARIAYLAGFASTSNLEAGRRYAVPTAGTAAHAFTMAHSSERAAFQAQVDTFGAETTLLVDTYDMEAAIAVAVEVAGTKLGAVRIDSGDLGARARQAREQLDRLGNRTTRVIVTGDLDDRSISALASAPIDGYGVGTSVVTGLGHPTAGFVYKLVSIGDERGEQHPVEKQSPGKASVGGRKWAWRQIRGLEQGLLGGSDPTVSPNRRAAGAKPDSREPRSSDVVSESGSVLVDVVTLRPQDAPEPSRPLQHLVVRGGVTQPMPSLEQLRVTHGKRMAEIEGCGALVLERLP